MVGWAIGRGSVSQPRSLQHCAFRHRKNDSYGREARSGLEWRESAGQCAPSSSGCKLDQGRLDFYWAHNTRRNLGARFPENVSTVPWPIKKGDQITISHDVWMRGDSAAVSRASAPVVGALRVGQTVSVEEVALLHARLGGDFIWARVSTSAVEIRKYPKSMPGRATKGLR